MSCRVLWTKWWICNDTVADRTNIGGLGKLTFKQPNDTPFLYENFTCSQTENQITAECSTDIPSPYQMSLIDYDERTALPEVGRQVAVPVTVVVFIMVEFRWPRLLRFGLRCRGESLLGLLYLMYIRYTRSSLRPPMGVYFRAQRKSIHVVGWATRE